jgi:CheY-like chemotaxis protein
VQITVEDHGKGIPPTALSTIFEMFAQLDRGNAEASEGLGIGLALSRHLVELHGGQIRAYSEGRGTGARFVVSLPVQRAPVDTAPSARGGEARALTVVVADDNVDSVESLAVLLTLDGHHVSVAHDGLTAVQLATDAQPDLAILDLGMPGIDGYEAAERMRALPGGGDLVLVALSGYAQAGDRQRSQQAGFDLHLVKPLDPERLRDLLAAVVTGRAGFRDSYAMGT